VPTKTVDILDAQDRFPELLSLVTEGTEIIITQNGTPLAHLVPVAAPSSARIAGLHANAITTTPDFDAPLPDDFWLGSDPT
jgi:prevent-host-death family protein